MGSLKVSSYPDQIDLENYRNRDYLIDLDPHAVFQREDLKNLAAGVEALSHIENVVSQYNDDVEVRVIENGRRKVAILGLSNEEILTECINEMQNNENSFIGSVSRGNHDGKVYLDIKVS